MGSKIFIELSKGKILIKKNSKLLDYDHYISLFFNGIYYKLFLEKLEDGIQSMSFSKGLRIRYGNIICK
jgi:hypothetical protein